jgi:hypothetical protein
MDEKYLHHSPEKNSWLVKAPNLSNVIVFVDPPLAASNINITTLATNKIDVSGKNFK